MKIFKFPLNSHTENIVIPNDYTILSVQMQSDIPTVWIMSDFDNLSRIKKIELKCIGTGWDF